jgi:hypothetical protein
MSSDAARSNFLPVHTLMLMSMRTALDAMLGAVKTGVGVVTFVRVFMVRSFLELA